MPARHSPQLEYEYTYSRLDTGNRSYIALMVVVAIHDSEMSVITVRII